jgi:predicted 2-oxoglutarate/Fe(II)-dependent dioxygenase YbiX
MDDKPIAVVLNPNLRVLGSVVLDESEGVVDSICSILSSGRSSVEALEVVTQAPVLLIPHVLEEEICQHLMKVWEEQGHSTTGVEYSNDAQRKDLINPDFKRRQDHTVQDPELIKLLTATIGRRVIPEVQKAFSFQASRFEGFKIACYDAAEEGFFAAHRDNLSPNTAHRRFALTLNLNHGHEGGHLRFPEYGPHLYRPGTGGALVFSGSLLHEVIPVSQGRRFTLLSFLFGEEDLRQKGR